MNVLLTGAAGFVGLHVAQALLARGDTVVGCDNLNGYCDPGLRHARLALLQGRPGFRFVCLDLADAAALERGGASGRPGRGTPFAGESAVVYRQSGCVSSPSTPGQTDIKEIDR